VKRALLVGALLLLPAAAGAELYRWIAPDGTVHYTADAESIPKARRPQVESLAHPQARPAPVPAPEPDAGTVTVPWAAGAPVVVEAMFNGVVLSLMVDTGADRTLISPEALARAGLSLDGGAPVWLTGVTGSVAATLLTLPYLDVAGLRLGPLPVVVHAMPPPGEAGTLALDGLLGRDLLDAFTITVDPGSGRPTLVPR
jgi:hypothetical protein